MKRFILTALWALLILQADALLAAPFGTGFTYQGRLLNGGAPANGYYDLKFTLFNVADFGFPVGPILTNSAVEVNEGAFTVRLDFGSNFNGEPRWLEVGTRTNGPGTFTILAPRQPLTPSPYAIQAAGLSGILPDSQLSGNIPRLNVGVTYASTVTAQSFSGNGSGLTSLTAANLNGVVPDSSLPSSLPRLNASNQKFTGNNTFVGLTAADGSGPHGSGASMRIGLATADGDPKMIYFGDGQFVSIGESGADDRMEMRGSPIVMMNASSANPTVLTNGNLGVGGFPGDARLDVKGPVRLNDNDVYLRGGTDRLHGLGWFGEGKLFAGQNVDGPVLYGFEGGALGTTIQGPRISLAWNGSGGVWLDASNVNNGGLTPGLTFGLASGEGIASKRTPGGNRYGLDFYTAAAARMHLSNEGDLGIGDQPEDAKLDVEGNVRINENDLFFESGSDRFHGVGWYGSGKLFGGNNVNGPVLYGFEGGGLGSTASSQKLALTWNAAQQVTMNGNLRMTRHDVLLNNDNNHGLGYYGAGKLYAGQNIDGPVLYGWSGGALGTLGTGTNWTLRWFSNGNVDLRGTLNPGSDRNSKTDFSPIDVQGVLDKVIALPVQQWRYKTEEETVRHVGTMSQDFRSAFGLGSDDKHIATVDADGVALAAIQGLNAKLVREASARDAEIRELRRNVEELKRVTGVLMEKSAATSR